MMSSSIPVLDFSPLSDENGRIPTEQNWDSTQKKIFKALSEMGFVYIVNHGIPQQTIEKSFQDSKGFFDLPLPVKLKNKRDYEIGQNHGYSEPNQEKLHPTTTYELKESFNFTWENRDTGTESYHGIEELETLQRTMSDLHNECVPLIKKILRLFARAVQEEENYFVNLSEGIWDSTVPTYTTLRTLYYPEIPKELKIEPGVVRCGEHTDYGILTLLFQDQIGGLEVKTVDDTWVPATPIPGSVLINTGDLLEFWTGGRFPATAHRVLIPEAEIKKRTPRQSIAYFIHPDHSAIVAPLKSAQSSDFQPINAYDHVKNRLDASYSY